MIIYQLSILGIQNTENGVETKEDRSISAPVNSLDINIHSHILESIHLFIARILGEVSFNYILCDRYCH